MGVVLYVVANRTRHVLVLPATMAFIVGAFYVLLLLTGTSLDEARHAKWLPEPGPPVRSPESTSRVAMHGPSMTAHQPHRRR
jgi:hypothetical protein